LWRSHARADTVKEEIPASNRQVAVKQVNAAKNWFRKPIGEAMAMEYYLCKHCKSITNYAWSGPCEDAIDGKHDWISGKKADTFVSRLWHNPVDVGTPTRTHSVS
jgi:hypothetical protein